MLKDIDALTVAFALIAGLICFDLWLLLFWYPRPQHNQANAVQISSEIEKPNTGIDGTVSKYDKTYARLEYCIKVVQYADPYLIMKETIKCPSVEEHCQYGPCESRPKKNKR